VDIDNVCANYIADYSFMLRIIDQKYYYLTLLLAFY